MQELVTKFNDDSVTEIAIDGFGTFEKDVFIKDMKPKAHIVVIKEGLLHSARHNINRRLNSRRNV